MPRPVKCRRVCSLPSINTFGPANKLPEEEVVMTVEEYESIRLMDYENMDQVECAEFMGVARSTFQRIYSEARKKIADSLVNGKFLKIEGGNFTICGNREHNRHCQRGCRWKYLKDK